MGVCLLPYEIIQYSDQLGNYCETEATPLFIVQKVLYYVTLVLSFLINPILIEYKQVTEKERQNDNLMNENESIQSTFLSRFKKAIKNQLLYYSILMIVFFVTVLIFALNSDIKLKSFMYLLPSILNIYGLFLYVLTIGFGLAQSPISIYKMSDPVNCLREYFIEIGENDDESEFNKYLLHQAKVEYKNLNDLIILEKPKQILKKNFFVVLSLLSLLFSIFVLVVEFSYSFGHSVLQSILSSINIKVYNQYVLFVFIGFVTLIGTNSLTCLSVPSLCSCRCCQFITRRIPFLNYKFKPKNTDTSTFSFWSTYIQRLIPTIGYHCQKLAGINSNTSFEKILGNLDEFYYYSFLIKCLLPVFLSIFNILRVLGFENSLDKDKIERGLEKFKNKFNILTNPELENYIIYDVNIRNRCKCCCRCNSSNNDINEQLNTNLNDFHNPFHDFDDFHI